MKTTLILLIPFLLFSISSCKKNQSTVTGEVTYIDSLGNSHTAANASISLYKNNNLATSPYDQNTSSSSGQYSFENLLDGNWTVYGEITVAGITYTGNTDQFFCEKDDVVTMPLVLH